MDDKLIIGAPDDIKQKAIALIVLSPFCLISWIFEWAGWYVDKHKLGSIFLIAVWVVAIIALIHEGNTQYEIDKNGVTRTMFKRYITFIPWEEMKYIGACIDEPDWPGPAGRSGYKVMLFSKIPYSEYKRFHIIIHRILDARHVISVRYVDDETYEKVLEFSGGERNIE